MKKRMLGMLLSVMLLCLLLLPTKAQAATVDSGTCGENLTWQIDDAGVLTVSGTGSIEFTGNSPWNKHKRDITKIVVEEGVTGITVNAFSGCAALTELELPDSLEFIDRSAFARCTALTDVEFGEKLIFIDEGAFEGCTGLTSVTIPGNVKQIGDKAFAGCSGLTEITISNGVEEIGDNAFEGCTGLTSITVPDSVERIGKDAFRRCTGLTSVELGDGFSAIFSGTFAVCTSLTRITIPDSVRVIHDGAFEACIQLTEVTLGFWISQVSPLAFSSCTSLTSIHVHEDNFDFRSIDGVLYSKDGKTLVQCPEGRSGSFTVPNGVIEIRDYAFYSCEKLEEVILSDSVNIVCSHAFLDCTALRHVSFGTGVATVWEYAFRNCTALTQIDFYGNAPMIVENAFFLVKANAYYPWGNETWTAEAQQSYDGELTWAGREPDCDHAWDAGTAVAPTCTESGYIRYTCPVCTYEVIEINAEPTGHNMDTTVIEATCETHGSTTSTCAVCGYTETSILYATGHSFVNGACAACGELAPEGLVAQGVCGEGTYWVLNSKGELTVSGTGPMADWQFSYTGSTTPWDAYRDQITKVIITDGVTYIGTSAFEGYENLKEVNMANSVTEIGNNAFKNCYGLTNATLSSSVTVIGDDAFCGCEKLTELILPEGLAEIGEDAFSMCKSLRSIMIPDSVTKLGKRAISYCMNLVYISIPHALFNSMSGWDMLRGCDNLWHILYREENESYYDNPLNHVGDAVITQERVEPQCATEGYIIYHCSGCDKSYSALISPVGHTWKQATCTNPAICRVCGEVQGQALGGQHNWGEGVVVQTPTETQEGVLQYTCAVCGETKLEPMNATAQTPDAQEPMNGTTLFILVIVGMVVVLLGASLVVVWIRRRA